MANSIKKEKILFVDDERSVLGMVEVVLADWSVSRGVELLTSDSPFKALELLAAGPGDVAVVVSDLNMPGMKGGEFLLKIRQQHPEIISILVTGRSETDEIVKAIKAGIFSFILKPWQADYLIAEIDKALEIFTLRREQKIQVQRLHRELRFAGEMQRALLHLRIPDSPKVEFKLGYKPLLNLECGGDYFDIIQLDGSRWLMLVGDVAGHGVTGAFITGILKAIIFQDYVKAHRDRLSPGAFLGWLNERLISGLNTVSGLIVTFCAGLLDLEAWTFTYSLAGQNPPLLVREGAGGPLAAAGPGLGFVEDQIYEEKCVPVQSGDRIFLYTDGLEEIQPPQRILASGRLYEILSAACAAGLDHEEILNRALLAAGASGFSDDVTLMTARLI